MSAVMMLHHIREHDIAKKVYSSVLRVWNDCKCLTIDLGGRASTSEYKVEVISQFNV